MKTYKKLCKCPEEPFNSSVDVYEDGKFTGIKYCMYCDKEYKEVKG